jgi:hypothetical protein
VAEEEQAEAWAQEDERHEAAFANLLMIFIAAGMLSRVPIPLCLHYNFVVAELQP